MLRPRLPACNRSIAGLLEGHLHQRRSGTGDTSQEACDVVEPTLHRFAAGRRREKGALHVEASVEEPRGHIQRMIAREIGRECAELLVRGLRAPT